MPVTPTAQPGASVRTMATDTRDDGTPADPMIPRAADAVTSGLVTPHTAA